MLFNSAYFIFIFLPIILMVFFWAGKISHGLAATWLVVASVIFYAWWSPVYVLLLFASIVFNFIVGYLIAIHSTSESGKRKILLFFGIFCNLAILSYFKYANFFIENINETLNTEYDIGNIILPLGISFFTFTQIAFLVDAARGQAKEFNFIHYSLFVTYYPHLIAGPVLHHKEMMPQFKDKSIYKFNSKNFTVGLTIFAIGLFKKTVFADGIAPYASPVFLAASQGQAIDFFQGWGGALAYTMQLYFDFSGYCDMAIGLSYMIGVRLPINFNSPYKAINISDFWRRWHITLSRFLRDYIYIPLGGNKKGEGRRYFNLMATMFLGGLWHGAGWTFVIWGCLHGFYLVIHQGWQKLRQKLGFDVSRSSLPGRVLGIGLTFFVVVLAWVFFRADTFGSALSIVRAMLGMTGISIPDGIGLRLGSLTPWLAEKGVRFTLGGGREFTMTFVWVLTLLPIIFLAPNSQQIMGKFKPALDQDVHGVEMHAAWTPNWRWGLAMAFVFAFGLLSLTRPSEFLYFQF